MPSIGEEFRVAREARNLSISDVAERIHIRSVYLESLENEDWQAIAAPVYVRGFIRTYARFLGIEPERAVAEYNSAIAEPLPAAESTFASREPRRPIPPALLTTGLVVVGLLAYSGYHAFHSHAENAQPPPYLSAVSPPPVASPSAIPSMIILRGGKLKDSSGSTVVIPPTSTPVPNAAPPPFPSLATHAIKSPAHTNAIAEPRMTPGPEYEIPKRVSPSVAPIQITIPTPRPGASGLSTSYPFVVSPAPRLVPEFRRTLVPSPQPFTTAAGALPTLAPSSLQTPKRSRWWILKRRSTPSPRPTPTLSPPARMSAVPSPRILVTPTPSPAPAPRVSVLSTPSDPEPTLSAADAPSDSPPSLTSESVGTDAQGAHPATPTP
ncbi:MAG TPA: helix-turn-helix domain-containing protein [Candidatus Baltobacteraceae bacterium]|nr:helix-turn-helix domain-containing protein [Candidatus Baltobacteraceae bacterium]